MNDKLDRRAGETAVDDLNLLLPPSSSMWSADSDFNRRFNFTIVPDPDPNNKLKFVFNQTNELSLTGLKEFAAVPQIDEADSFEINVRDTLKKRLKNLDIPPGGNGNLLRDWFFEQPAGELRK